MSHVEKREVIQEGLFTVIHISGVRISKDFPSREKAQVWLDREGKGHAFEPPFWKVIKIPANSEKEA